MNRILLLEDDVSLIDGLVYSLKKNEFDVEVARTVCEAKQYLSELDRYDLLILDVTLPDGTGFDVCERVRKENQQIPIIFLTASDEEVSIIRGLDSGGDDYITKPFKLGELYSRIRALLRRAGVSKSEKNTSMECGDITIDLLGSRATLKGKALDLTSAEYRLLCLLVRNANRVVTRDIILNELWDDTGNFVDDNTLSVYVRRLREKVETNPSHPEHLITIRGFGYQWKEMCIRDSYMSLYQDRQIKGFLLFLTLFALLFVGTATVLTIYQVNDAEVLWLKHDEAVSSSLLEQGVPKEVVAVAFTNTDISDDGRSLLAAAGLGKQSESSMRPYFNQFQRSAFCTMLCTVLFFLFVLAIGIFIFFWKRKRLYQQADKILLNYINGDYSCHLPQNYEGAIYQVFSSIEQLATMLQSKNETERKAKEFLKDTISDISHQLKTPLAALTMYQEIIESEPENAETVKQFAAKMGISLKRMEQLILSMLKITRLDTGNIIFEKKSCRVSELIAHSVNDLTTRAKSESKQIQIDGDGEQQLICDMEWTGEAIGNIVKNALDHTQAGGIVRITWERTPAMFRIFISDNGNGIVPEDIYHIFKRFYRSKHSLDTQGIGLGLPLAKSIIEGQNGVISVQSEVGKGTLFTLSFLTDL